jgi:hypothetical protein
MSVTNSAVARIAAQQRQMGGKLISCERCGSTHFYQVNAVQVTRGYGTVEVSLAMDTQEFQTWKCIACDFVVTPQVPVGRKASGIYEGAHKEYRESVKKGQEFILSLDPHVAIQAAAGKHVEDAVTRLEGRVTTLEDTERTTSPIKQGRKVKDEGNEATK